MIVVEGQQVFRGIGLALPDGARSLPGCIFGRLSSLSPAKNTATTTTTTITIFIITPPITIYRYRY